jgi:AraC-like DNA-binding protein
MKNGLPQIQDWLARARAAQWCAATLANDCGVSPRQLQRYFQRTYARTPQDWLNEQRLQTAPTKLLTGQPIKVVASELGFKQSSHFCREFKAYHQMTPSEFVALSLKTAECRSQITNVAAR